MPQVIVVIGAGQIGQAIARRVGVGKHVVLADLRPDNANAAAAVLANAGYEVSVATVDASSMEAVRGLVQTATALGDVTGLIHAAGVSPSQASPATIQSGRSFITGSDFLMDGRVTAAYWYGELAPRCASGLGTEQ